MAGDVRTVTMPAYGSGGMAGGMTAALPANTAQPEPSGAYEIAQRLVQEIAETRSVFGLLEERIGHALKPDFPEIADDPKDRNPEPTRCPIADVLSSARKDLARLRYYIASVTDRADA